MGKPVLFRQQRPGLGGRGFVIYKFRTMTDQADKSGQPLPDEQRLPALGRFLASRQQYHSFSYTILHRPRQLFQLQR
jgi:lipopolysaccharide/colanic/teichoic acid biosynthesis glycosyltransferase